jgi:hypothetical protein
VACPSESPAGVVSVKEPNGKALEEASRRDEVLNGVNDGNAAHSSSASITEVTKVVGMMGFELSIYWLFG